MHGLLKFRKDILREVTSGKILAFSALLNYSTWLAWLYRLMGASISRQTLFGANSMETDWDVVKVGSNCFVGPAVTLKTWRFEGSKLIIRKIEIESKSSVGSWSVLQGGSIMREGSQISSGSLVRGREHGSGLYSGLPVKMVSEINDTSSVERTKFFPWYDIPGWDSISVWQPHTRPQ